MWSRSRKLIHLSFSLFIILFISLPFFKVCFAINSTRPNVLDKNNYHQKVNLKLTNQINPFSPRAQLIRYWNKQVTNNHPKPKFFFTISSPLSAVECSYIISELAASNVSRSLCSKAMLFCSFEDARRTNNDMLAARSAHRDANFALYSNKHFSNYGGSRLGGSDSFKNYSDGLNSVDDSFIKYSREATGHSEAFTSYGNDGNVANATFGNYGSGATGGSGEFKNYEDRVNVPGLRFTTYDSDSNNHTLSFTSYSGDTNAGSQGFNSYGKKGNSATSEFTNYSEDSNIIDSTFTSYSDLGNAGNDSFTTYGNLGNNPRNSFKSYGTGENSGTATFSNYRNRANVGQDSFQTYARNGIAAKVNFANYGKTFNPGNDTFKDYGKGSKGKTMIGFKSYSIDRSFKQYNNTTVTFAGYSNSSLDIGSKGDFGNKMWVEPGKFFRESMLKEGNVMVMPDIRDKMPKRLFLPRSIVLKLPFSTARISDIRTIFGVQENSTTEHVILNAMADCERAPSRGETKKCVGSAEDMIDFAVSILGHNVEVRTTENVVGSSKNVWVGSVKGINDGYVTESVSCHQTLYPYLLYYCHSVPKVRVYEVDLHDVESKVKINHGVAICHLDTSAWGLEHGAFVALGSRPGLIEVCHWIFENDMTWIISD